MPYKEPPTKNQFGKPEGNQRGKGFWKKEDTARYQLEQMLRLTEADIEEIRDDKSQPLFKRRVAEALIEGSWKTLEAMLNQAYGTPKQQIEQVALEMPLPLSPRKQRPELQS